MISSIAYSQDSIKVKKETLERISRFVDKCDSLKVAYTYKSQLLDSLIMTNYSVYKDLRIEQKKTIDLTKKLEVANDEIIKAYKNPFQNINSFLTGGVVGFLLAVFLFAI